MNNDQARALGIRIINTWHGTPPIAEWITALEPLDHDHAAKALAQLQRTEQFPPTIAKYLAIYRGLVRSRPTGPTCSTCDGTGYIDCTDDRRHRPTCLTPDDCTCHAVIPCPLCSRTA